MSFCGMTNPYDALMEIEARNALRASAQLPRLDVEKELESAFANERIREYHRALAQFEHCRRPLQQKYIARVRRLRGDPDWRPNAVEGWGMNVHVQAVLNRLLLKAGLIDKDDPLMVIGRRRR